MVNAEIYIYSSINSIKAVDGFGGFICVCKRKDGTDGTLAYQCELQGATKLTSEIMLLTQALSKFKRPCSVTVHLTNPQTITTLNAWMPAWKLSGWKNSKGEDVDGWYKTLDRYMEGHELTYTADRGEYSTWLGDNTRRHREKGEKGCLISLESLAALKS
jgi:ribonuclease HI